MNSFWIVVIWQGWNSIHYCVRFFLYYNRSSNLLCLTVTDDGEIISFNILKGRKKGKKLEEEQTYYVTIHRASGPSSRVQTFFDNGMAVRIDSVI